MRRRPSGVTSFAGRPANDAPGRGCIAPRSSLATTRRCQPLHPGRVLLRASGRANAELSCSAESATRSEPRRTAHLRIRNAPKLSAPTRCYDALPSWSEAVRQASSVRSGGATPEARDGEGAGSVRYSSFQKAFPFYALPVPQHQRMAESCGRCAPGSLQAGYAPEGSTARKCRGTALGEQSRPMSAFFAVRWRQLPEGTRHRGLCLARCRATTARVVRSGFCRPG